MRLTYIVTNEWLEHLEIILRWIILIVFLIAYDSKHVLEAL